jgi:hypothetical protein
MGQEFITKIKLVKDIVLSDYGDYLGINLFNRLPHDIEVLFLSPEKYVELVKNEYPYIPTDSHAFCNMDKYIYINDITNRTLEQKLKTLTHELIHAISYVEPYRNENNHLRFHRIGFEATDTSKYGLLDEGMVELTTWFIIKNYWNKHELLNEYVPKSHSELRVNYANMVVLLDMIISKISKINNQSYLDILKIFQQSHIQNPTIGLKMFESALGDDGIKLLENILDESLNNDANFVKLVDQLPLKDEFKLIQDGSGVYKFWDKL